MIQIYRRWKWILTFAGNSRVIFVIVWDKHYQKSVLVWGGFFYIKTQYNNWQETVISKEGFSVVFVALAISQQTQPSKIYRIEKKKICNIFGFSKFSTITEVHFYLFRCFSSDAVIKQWKTRQSHFRKWQ